MVHSIKTLSEYFNNVQGGIKKFELRKNDRDYKSGDIVIMNEWDQKSGYTGARVAVHLCYVIKDEPSFGLKDGYCIFCWNSLEKLTDLPRGWYWNDHADGSGGLYKADNKAFASYDLTTGEVWFINYDNGTYSHDYQFDVRSILEAKSIIERKVPGLKEQIGKCIQLDLF